ncbi:SurA N-terminal domain-containing protein [Patescibacteria group bacterium]|nr:SurA N-terminal domain-containing protein [Patescibacteria group bacterium]
MPQGIKDKKKTSAKTLNASKKLAQAERETKNNLSAGFLENLKSKIPYKKLKAEKLKRKQFIIPLIIVLLIALLYIFKGLFVVATVNGEPITSIAFLNEMKQESGKQSLNSLITQALITQEAKRKNIKVSNKEIDSQMKTIENNLKSQGENLDAVLSQRGITKQELRNQIKIQLMVNKLLGNKAKVTDKEINDYYNKNKKSLPPGMDEKSAKQSIKQQLQQEKIASVFQTWLAGLRAKAKINYFINP